MPGFSQLYSSAFKHIGLFRKLLFGSNTFSEDKENKHMEKLEINILLYCIHTCNHIAPTAVILTCASRLQPLQGHRLFAHKYNYENNVHNIQLFIFPFSTPFFSVFSILFIIPPPLRLSFSYPTPSSFLIFSTALFVFFSTYYAFSMCKWS
jgi:hypothetical protein